jgi:hypothetical protein
VNGKHRNGVKKRGFRVDPSARATWWFLPSLPLGAFKSLPPSQPPTPQENRHTAKDDPESAWIVVWLIGSTLKIGPQG